MGPEIRPAITGLSTRLPYPISIQDIRRKCRTTTDLFRKTGNQRSGGIALLLSFVDVMERRRRTRLGSQASVKSLGIINVLLNLMSI